MAELCHVCDLFRTALFGATNSTEDHLDDGQGNNLPSPMADAPAKLRVRPRNRASSTRNAKPDRNPDAVAQLTRGSGATAAPSVTSNMATPISTVPGAAAVSTMEPSKGGAREEIAPVSESPAVKPAPKTKFSKRASRELKSPCMSFDDVEVEEDDSDGELFVDDRRDSSSHSRGTGASPYSVKQNVPSANREVDLTGSAAKAPSATYGDAPSPPAARNSKRTYGWGEDTVAGTDGANTRGPSDAAAATAGTTVSSDQHDVEPGLSMEAFPTASGSGLVEDHATIPRDGSALESARPHGQSDSFHGYTGYPGYEPDTPIAESLAVQHSQTTESLMVNPGADVDDPRTGVEGVHMVPTPSSVHDPLAESAVPSDYGYMYGEAQRYYPQAATSPSGAEVRDQYGHVQITSTIKRQNYHPQPQTQYQQQQQQYAGPGSGTNVTDVSHRDRGSPSHSAAGSMASSFRRDENNPSIPQVSSEDGMGSVLGTIAGSDFSHNEDLHWKKSALKKFHKVMVKGEGLRVVKHNRSGGSQPRIIRYDPKLKALVWDSKRYMKKAGSANIPIVDIKRVGQEGKTVSVTAAGRGTIGFEPQRTRDAEILSEALLALVDKEKRSATWRG